MNDGLLKSIDGCPALPTLPTVALEVLELAKSTDSDLDRLAEIIERDPALAGRVLKTVNSSFYGRSKKVTTIQQSLIVMGLQSVRTLVLGFSLLDGMKDSGGGGEGGFDHKLYWRRSFYAACAAKHIGRTLGLMQAEELFVCGLLGDIGMLVLDACMGDKYGPVCDGAPSHPDLAAAETAALGGHHGEVGGYIADKWKLPPVLAEPIRWHVEPEQADDETLRQMAQIVSLAGRCADVYTDAEPATAIRDVREQVKRLMPSTGGGADADMADTLLAGVGDLTREAAASFDFDLGETAKYEKILPAAPTRRWSR